MIITGLLDLHSMIRYASLVLLIISIIIAAHGLTKDRRYSQAIRKWHLWTIIFLNIQLLSGLALYILKGYYSAWANLSNTGGMFAFFGIDHFLGMLIAVSLVNMGYHTAVRKPSDHDIYRRITLFYSIGLVIIFMLIPWPFFHSWATWF